LIFSTTLKTDKLSNNRKRTRNKGKSNARLFIQSEFEANKPSNGDKGLIRGLGPGCLIQFVIAVICCGVGYLARQSSGLLKYFAWAIGIIITLVWFVDKILTIRDRMRE
jgi:hypothetical protein